MNSKRGDFIAVVAKIINAAETLGFDTFEMQILFYIFIFSCDLTHRVLSSLVIRLHVSDVNIFFCLSTQISSTSELM